MPDLPKSTSLVICPVCGRTDRFSSLKEAAGRHYSRGRVCSGIPRTHHYVLAVVTDEVIDGLADHILGMTTRTRVQCRGLVRAILDPLGFSTSSEEAKSDA